MYDKILDKELDLSFLHDFFRVLDKLKFDVPLETVKVFELCGPEFRALKLHVQEAYARRDADIQNYASLLTENLAKVSGNVYLKLRWWLSKGVCWYTSSGRE